MTTRRIPDGTPVQSNRNQVMRAAAHKTLDELLDSGSIRGTHGAYAVRVIVVDGTFSELERDVQDRKRFVEGQ